VCPSPTDARSSTPLRATPFVAAAFAVVTVAPASMPHAATSPIAGRSFVDMAARVGWPDSARGTANVTGHRLLSRRIRPRPRPHLTRHLRQRTNGDDPSGIIMPSSSSSAAPPHRNHSEHPADDNDRQRHTEGDWSTPMPSALGAADPCTMGERPTPGSALLAAALQIDAGLESDGFPWRRLRCPA
jgi:hypothetical protein